MISIHRENHANVLLRGCTMQKEYKYSKQRSNIICLSVSLQIPSFLSVVRGSLFLRRIVMDAGSEVRMSVVLCRGRSWRIA